MLGRPSIYSEEIADAICEKIIGGMSVRQLCREPGMPSETSVYVWLDRHPAFAAKYTRARSAQTEAMLEEMLEIADKDGLDPQEKRVRIDTRKWAMSKLHTRRYGDVQKLEHSGPDGAPIEINSTVGLAVAAVRELRGLRMDSGALPAPSEDDAADVL